MFLFPDSRGPAARAGKARKGYARDRWKTAVAEKQTDSRKARGGGDPPPWFKCSDNLVLLVYGGYVWMSSCSESTIQSYASET